MTAQDSPWWNPKTETLSREQLDGLQLAKLRIAVARARQLSTHYATTLADFHDEALQSLANLSDLPFLTRDAWEAGQLAKPPFGTLPITTTTAATRLHTTSGTSGSMPLRAMDNAQDWSWNADMWCYGLWAQGIRSSDTAYVAFGYGSFIGFWGLHYGLEKIGALTIPGGAQPTAARIRQIIDFEATVVASTPTYALRLAEEATILGIDLQRSSVRRLVLSGEPCPPATRLLIESRWGARAFDTAGMTEIGTIFQFECQESDHSAHIIEDHLLEEVIDPKSGQSCDYGELGERVVTSFGRSTTPLIRYRTGDMVRRVPASSCSCGRGFDLYEGGVLGRADDMLVIRGTNVYPRAIEAIVREFPIVEFQTRIYRTELRDEIELSFEAETGHDPTTIGVDLAGRLADAHEGLRIHVRHQPQGTLPRFDLKARRFSDERVNQ